MTKIKEEENIKSSKGKAELHTGDSHKAVR